MTVQIIGTEAVVAMLDRKTAAIRDRLIKAQKVNGITLADHVIANKLSGQVLKVRTNRLRGSIHDDLRETDTEVSTSVGTNVEYARIHEFGLTGTVQVKEHLRTVTQAFGRPISPRQVTVRSHPMNMRMPERSFLRSALRDKRDEAMARIRKAVDEGTQS